MEFRNLDRFQFEDSEKRILGELLYDKIKGAILNKEDKAILFMLLSSSDSDSPGVIFTIGKDQFSIFLDRYLKACETEELYELCSEIVGLKTRID